MMKPSQPAAAQPTAQSGAQSATQTASTLLLLLLFWANHARGQALPAAQASPISTGFALPSLAGSLRYALTASQTVTSGYFGSPGLVYSTNMSGDLAFSTSNQRAPFSMVFSGGHGWATSQQPSFTFMNFAVSQAADAGRWIFLLSDSVSYLPGTASTGLSGVPGMGDLGVSSTPTGGNTAPVGASPAPVGANPGQGVLTGLSSQVDNTSSLTLQRPLNGKTSMNGSGSYTLMRFVNNSSSSTSPGLDSNSYAASLGLSYRIDARNSLGGNYAYTRSTFSGNSSAISQPGFASQTASMQLTHQFTRKLATSLAAGPEWTSIDTPGGSPSLSFFANLSSTYTGEFSHASLAYSRSANSGYGVVGGAISSSITFSANRTFNRVWLCAVTAAYTQTSDLPSAGALSFNFHTTVAGGQISRAIGRNLSTYASYTVQDQSNQGTQAAVDLFSGRSQVTGFGLTYSPTAIRIGHP